MNTITQDYLIQKFAFARDKQARYTDNTKYWSGIMDTYHTLLAKFYPGWANNGTTGYYVFYENMDYDKAVFYSRTGLPVATDESTWCHYSGMPSPQAYSSQQDTDLIDNAITQ